MSYLDQRLNEICISKEDHTIRAKNQDGKFYNALMFCDMKNKPAMSVSDIMIKYYDPEGEPYYFDDSTKATSVNREGTREFYRIRYSPENIPAGGGKYSQPKGSEVYPFNTPAIIQQYRKAVSLRGNPEQADSEQNGKIKTLIITEGEFKAITLNKIGFYCIGIGGIHNFLSGTKDSINKDILGVIEVCKVENVVILYDADCFDIKWKDGEEATMRPKGFRDALVKFADFLKNYPVTVYFSHVKADSGFKGIDDLFFQKKGTQHPKFEQIKLELLSLSEGNSNRVYISTYRVSSASHSFIERIFKIDSVKSFYEAHEDILFDKDFKFKGLNYHISSDGKLELSYRGEENQYLLVGNDYYKRILTNRNTGTSTCTDVNLSTISKGRITDDYGRKFLKLIPTYENFVNEPDNDPEKYATRIIIEKSGMKTISYNTYSKVEHEPKAGEFPNIDKLLHHIFDYKNTSGESLYEFILDWIQITYLYPKKHLPVICLVSRANKTGKSTFLDLLKNIYGNNMAMVDCERFNKDFNSSYAGRLIISIDETLLEQDKAQIKNKLKALVTNNIIQVEAKGRDSYEINNYSKLVMCSNDEDNFMRIDADEIRYCVIKVGKIEEEDHQLSKKMAEEIPYFLHFLKNRNLHYQERTRIYFNEKVFETPQFLKVVERTEHPIKKAIRETITEQFDFATDFNNGIIPVKISLSRKIIYDRAKLKNRKVTESNVSEFLKDNGEKARKYGAKFYWYEEPFENEDLPRRHETSGRPFDLSSEKWHKNS